MSSSSLGEAHITKLTAARRQLCAAIRMFFVREDELAIHTVASAAYRVISDLKSKRGHDEVGDCYLTGVFYAIRDYRRGTLPSYLADNPEMMKSVREWAEKMPITETSKYEDIKATVSPDVARDFWTKRNKVSNFLKHADNDESTHISMEEVDNLPLLMQALSSYLDLDRGGPGHEGYILWMYSCVDSGMVEPMLSRDLEVALYLEPLSRDERLKFCSEFLKEWKGKEEEI